jgi:hypothetical protein
MPGQDHRLSARSGGDPATIDEDLIQAFAF